MGIRLRPLNNGDDGQWDRDDADDKLADKLAADGPAPIQEDGIATLPAMPKPSVREKLQERVKDRPNDDAGKANVRDVALSIAQLLTDDKARCWVEASTFHATKLVTRDGKTFQRHYEIEFGRVAVKTVELIQ